MDILLLFCVLLTLLEVNRGQPSFYSRTNCPNNCRCISGGNSRASRYHSMYNDYISQKMYGFRAEGSSDAQGREMTCLGLLAIPEKLPTDLVKLNIFGGRKGLINPQEDNVYSDEPAHAGGRESTFYQITGLSKDTFSSLNSLKDLVISGNKIPELKDELKPLQNLETLTLRKNQIQKVEDYSLRGLTRLKSVDIGHNFIAKIPRSLFLDTVNVDTLKLGSNWIGFQGLHRDTFIALFNLRILDLSDNQLAAIHPDLFRGNKLLEDLDLSDNNLKNLVGGWFWPVPRLKKLNLKGNLLLNIQGVVFKPLRLLSELNLANNKLGFLHRNVFLPLPKLKKLDLSENELRRISSYVFADLGNLEDLHLQKNGIKWMANGSFIGLSKLKRLSLAGNDLRQVHSEAFKPLKYVKKLDLSDNRIKSLKDRSFFGMHNIRELYLENNDISSIEDGALLVSWLRHYSRLVWLSLQNNKLTYLSPNVFRSAPHVKHLDLGQNELYNMDENTFKHFRDLTTLKLEHNQLSELPDDIFNKAANLQLLDLGNNKLLYLTANIFMSLANVQDINLADNRIMSMPTSVFSNASALVYLDLSGNNLRSLDMDMLLKNRNLRRLKVANSSLMDMKMNEIPRYKLDYLDISGNKLKNLDAKLVSWLGHNGTLLIGGNILTCDCHINWLNDAVLSQFIRAPDYGKMICKTPVWTAGKLLSSLRKSDLVCIKPPIDPTTKSVEEPKLHNEVKESRTFCQPKTVPRGMLEEWHATVFNAKKESICAGVRLSDDFILTHASCWKYHGITSTDIQLGRIFIKTGSERKTQSSFLFRAKKVIFHPDMVISSRSEYRAVALVHLESLRRNSESNSYPCIANPTSNLFRKRAAVYFLTAKSQEVKPKTRIRLRTITTRGVRQGACDGVRYACTKSLLKAMPSWRYLTEGAPLYNRYDFSLVGIRSMRQAEHLQTFIGLYDIAAWIYGIVK